MGTDPNFTKITIQLIDFMIEEAGEDPEVCITYINSMIEELDKYNKDNKMEVEVTQSNVGEGHTNEAAPLLMREEAQHQPVRLRDRYPEP